MKPRILYAGPPWFPNANGTVLEPAPTPTWVEAVTLASFGDRAMALTVTANHPYISPTVVRADPSNLRVPEVRQGAAWFMVESGDFRRKYVLIALDLPAGWGAIPAKDGLFLLYGVSLPDQVLVPSPKAVL